MFKRSINNGVKVTQVKKVAPFPTVCVVTDSPDRLFQVQTSSKQPVFTHNSVTQLNVAAGCFLRPEHWLFLGIDLKKVELSPYRDFSNCLQVATTLEDAVDVLRFAQDVMMRRYKVMEDLGINKFADYTGKDKRAIMVMVDEAKALLSTEGTGKALSLDTEVYSETGQLKPLKQVKVGERILDSRLQPAEVIADDYVEEETVDLTFTDEEGKEATVRAGVNHLWVVQLTSETNSSAWIAVTTKVLCSLFTLVESLPYTIKLEVENEL